MYFYHPEDRAAKELFAGINARTFWGEQMLMAVVDLEPNSQLPLHQHPHEQGGIVLQGELELTVAGQTQLLKAGDVYIVPGGTEHSARTGDSPTRVVDIFSPVREEYKY